MPSTSLSRSQRREVRIGLATLPFGAVTLVVSALALPAVVSLAIAAPFRGGVWFLLWALLAAIVAVRNMLAGIAIMAGFDWRPAPLVLARSGAIVAGWPGWWS
ncbi:hypothetical protein [Sphingomonas sp.]|uniref:hypothetical protein n=1 Tax=Sphingomonas sp. TaxID=28214 RepID=UPI003AFF6EA2